MKKDTLCHLCTTKWHNSSKLLRVYIYMYMVYVHWVQYTSLIERTAYQACRLNSSITRRGREVWRLILHKGQACLWWFRQTVALATCRETEMVGCGGGGILRQQGLFRLCLNTDNSCRLGVANRYIKAVKRLVRHDNGILQEQPASGGSTTHEDKDEAPSVDT